MKSSKWLTLAVLPFAVACTDDDDVTNNSSQSLGDGIYISNEGPFQGGNGSLSFYNPETKEVTNEVFLEEIGRPLGNIVQSVSINNDQLYIVINNSGAVEIVDLDDFSSEGTVAGLNLPRYAMGIDANTVAVSAWGTNTVEIVNTSSASVTSSVTTGTGPERMLLDGQSLYVANCGGYGIDSTVTVINTSDFTVANTFQVGYNPNSMVLDADGNLWVLCGGYTDWNDASNNEIGSLYKLNAQTGAVLDTFNFGNTPRPAALCINSDGNTLYFLENGYGGAPFAMSTTATELPTTALISGVYGYGMGIDADANELYITDPVDYASAGKVYRYDLSASAVVDTLNVDIIPGNIAVK